MQQYAGCYSKSQQVLLAEDLNAMLHFPQMVAEASIMWIIGQTVKLCEKQIVLQIHISLKKNYICLKTTGENVFVI